MAVYRRTTVRARDRKARYSRVVLSRDRRLRKYPGTYNFTNSCAAIHVILFIIHYTRSFMCYYNANTGGLVPYNNSQLKYLYSLM